MKIVAIIVTFNGKPWIDQCLTSLMESSIPIDIIVIDNLSKDNTVDHVKRCFPQVTLIVNKENLGFGKANNRGIKEAILKNADYVFLLNQDAWIEKYAVSSLIGVAEKNPDYGVLSGIHLSGDGSQLDYSFSKYLAPDICPSFLSDLYLRRENLQDIYETSFVNAAAWLIRKECIQTVGGFDPLFRHYGEDIDYINRVHYHGYKVGICPSATIFHDRNNDPHTIKVSSSTKQRIFMQLLYVMKDVRYSLLKMYWVSLSRSFKIFIESLFNKNGKKAIDAISLMFKVTTYLPKVYKSRKRSKTQGISYLD